MKKLLVIVIVLTLIIGAGYLTDALAQPISPRGALYFCQLFDTPGNYTDQDGKYVKVDESSGELVFIEGSGVINVKDYGATGDGVTDDTTAINAALTAGAGGTVLIPDGTYRVTSDLLISANTTILFQSWNAIIKMDSESNARRIFNTQGNDYITIKNGKIDGQHYAAVGHTGIALSLGSNYCTVENMWTVNCGQYGIADEDTGTNNGGNGHRILFNLVDMTNAYSAAAAIGIEIFPKGGAGYLANPGVLIQGNIVIGGSTALDGIKINAQRGARIIGNYVNGIDNASGAGAITVVSSEHCLVANNTIVATRIGISLGGQAGTDNGLRNNHLLISGNIIRNFSFAGIYTSAGFSDLVIFNNVLDLDGGVAISGIHLESNQVAHPGLLISSNKITDCINAIRLKDDDATGLLGYPRVKINDNIIVGGAIRFEDAPYAQVNDNQIYEAYQYSIFAEDNCDYVSAQNNMILNGNTFDSANVSGIYIDGDFPQISDNHIENIGGGSGNMKYGIWCANCDRPTIRDNVINNMDTSWYYLTGVTNIIATLADESTPSVGDTMGSDGRFLTGGVTTITDFDDGIAGQIINIISEHTITITDGTNIFLNQDANWTMAAEDTLTLVCKADNKWYELASTYDEVGAGGGDAVLINTVAITDGSGVDLTDGVGITITLDTGVSPDTATFAFDPTEILGSKTWGDGSTDTIVWTWNRATGTDPTVTFNSGSIGLQALTLTTDLAVADGGTGQSNLTNLIALTTHTTGNYVATVAAGTGITIAEADSEGATKTVVATLGTSIETGELATDAVGVDALDQTISPTLTGRWTFAGEDTGTDVIGLNINWAGVDPTNGQLEGDLWYDSTLNLYKGYTTHEIVLGSAEQPGIIQAKKGSGGTIAAGDAVYITGFDGTDILVELADADDAAKMPAIGIAEATINSGTAGAVTTFGLLESIINTVGMAIGDGIWVTATGTSGNTLTNTKPTGATTAIQRIATVVTTEANGELFVAGALRTNDESNLTEAYIFVGDASSYATAVAMSGEVSIVANGTTTIADSVAVSSWTLTTPTITNGAVFTGEDVNPNTAGEIVYDNAIAGIMSGGGLRWYDDNSVRLIVDLETDPSSDDYVVAYDSAADGFYMKVDADSGGTPTVITVADTTDTTSFVALWETATGDLAPKSDLGLTYNAGTANLAATTFTGALTGAASGNVLNSESDVMTGTLTADGLTLGQDENITLGSQTLDHDGTDFVFNDSVNLGANALITSVNIKSMPRHLIFNLFNPLGVQTEDTQVCIWPVTPAALTVTKIVITLNAAANEVLGDLKYADTFIGLANPVIINDFDTTSGVRTDDTITSAAIAAGKTIYIQFDSAPHTDITQMCVDVTFDFD